jgi:hypothetical protein
MYAVFAVSVIGALSILLLPRQRISSARVVPIPSGVDPALRD